MIAALVLMLVVAATAYATLAGADLLGLLAAVSGVIAAAWFVLALAELRSGRLTRARVTQIPRSAAAPGRLGLTRSLAWWIAGRLWSPGPRVRLDTPPQWAATPTAHHHRKDTPP